MALIKGGFTSRAKVRLNLPPPTASREKHREGTVWQRRFWEHTIQDEADYCAHCDYIHYNPVKDGLVEMPGAWPYTTFHRFVEQGIYAPDWGATAVPNLKDVGRE
jgi:putative transposase